MAMGTRAQAPRRGGSTDAPAPPLRRAARGCAPMRAGAARPGNAPCEGGRAGEGRGRAHWRDTAWGGMGAYHSGRVGDTTLSEPWQAPSCGHARSDHTAHQRHQRGGARTDERQRRASVVDNTMRVASRTQPDATSASHTEGGGAVGRSAVQHWRSRRVCTCRQSRLPPRARARAMDRGGRAHAPP